MTDGTKKSNHESKPPPTVVKVEPVGATFTVPTVTIWDTCSYASEWFGDALSEARMNEDRNGIRSEILFAVCAAESYLFEWVRDDVLQRDFKILNEYFPPEDTRPILKKWKEVIKQLHADGALTECRHLENGIGIILQNWFDTGMALSMLRRADHKPKVSLPRRLPNRRGTPWIA